MPEMQETWVLSLGWEPVKEESEKAGLNSIFKKLRLWNPVLSAAAAAKLLQSCPTLCDPIDGSPPDSPVPGILQARTVEWVTISFSNALK